MNEHFSLLTELVSHSAHVGKLLISSEIAMNDGNLQESMKYTKEAQGLLKTMKSDVFEEFNVAFNIQNVNSYDYDIPTPLELSKCLFSLQFNCGSLMSLLSENKTGTLANNLTNQIASDIATILEIYTAIYDN